VRKRGVYKKKKKVGQRKGKSTKCNETGTKGLIYTQTFQRRPAVGVFEGKSNGGILIGGRERRKEQSSLREEHRDSSFKEQWACRNIFYNSQKRGDSLRSIWERERSEAPQIKDGRGGGRQPQSKEGRERVLGSAIIGESHGICEKSQVEKN